MASSSSFVTISIQPFASLKLLLVPRFLLFVIINHMGNLGACGYEVYPSLPRITQFLRGSGKLKHSAFNLGTNAFRAELAVSFSTSALSAFATISFIN
jgi:hypothetical protein